MWCVTGFIFCLLFLCFQQLRGNTLHVIRCVLRHFALSLPSRHFIFISQSAETRPRRHHRLPRFLISCKNASSMHFSPFSLTILMRFQATQFQKAIQFKTFYFYCTQIRNSNRNVFSSSLALCFFGRFDDCCNFTSRDHNTVDSSATKKSVCSDVLWPEKERDLLRLLLLSLSVPHTFIGEPDKSQLIRHFDLATRHSTTMSDFSQKMIFFNTRLELQQNSINSVIR